MIEEAEEARTPDVVLAEVARKYLREGIDEEETRSRLRSMQSATTITPIDVNVGVQSGKAFIELADKATKERLQRPSLFDAIILATARTYQAKIVTGDEHFRGLPEAISI
jgi:predicted nucleic acid-binding protein